MNGPNQLRNQNIQARVEKQERRIIRGHIQVPRQNDFWIRRCKNENSPQIVEMLFPRRKVS